MQHHHGVADHAGRITAWLTECQIVQPQLGQDIARLELEILRDVVAALDPLSNETRRREAASECRDRKGQGGQSAIGARHLDHHRSRQRRPQLDGSSELK